MFDELLVFCGVLLGDVGEEGLGEWVKDGHTEPILVLTFRSIASAILLVRQQQLQILEMARDSAPISSMIASSRLDLVSGPTASVVLRDS
jgi:hypothetical protein